VLTVLFVYTIIPALLQQGIVYIKCECLGGIGEGGMMSLFMHLADFK